MVLSSLFTLLVTLHHEFLLCHKSDPWFAWTQCCPLLWWTHHIVCLLKLDLTCFVVSKNGAPKHLPVAFHNLLKLSLGLEDKTAELAWATLLLFAWNFDHEAEDPRKTSCVHLKYMRLFLEHGSSPGKDTEMCSWWCKLMLRVNGRRESQKLY